MVERSGRIVMLGCGLNLRLGQTKPHGAFAGVEPLHRTGRDDVIRLAEMMQEVDDEVALTACIARPLDLAGLPIPCLDPEALDAFVVADHSVGEQPRTLALSSP